MKAIWVWEGWKVSRSRESRERRDNSFEAPGNSPRGSIRAKRLRFPGFFVLLTGWLGVDGKFVPITPPGSVMSLRRLTEYGRAGPRHTQAPGRHHFLEASSADRSTAHPGSRPRGREPRGNAVKPESVHGSPRPAKFLPSCVLAPARRQHPLHPSRPPTRGCRRRRRQYELPCGRLRRRAGPAGGHSRGWGSATRAGDPQVARKVIRGGQPTTPESRTRPQAAPYVQRVMVLTGQEPVLLLPG